MKRYRVRNYFNTFVDFEFEAETEAEARQKYLTTLANGAPDFDQNFATQALRNLKGDEFLDTEVTEIK